jgi:hypothetical protein
MSHAQITCPFNTPGRLAKEVLEEGELPFVHLLAVVPVHVCKEILLRLIFGMIFGITE